MFFRFFFLIEQLNVIIGSLSLLFTALYFQFCLRDTEKKKNTKKLQVGTREWQICFFSECVHEKTPCILCQHALQLIVWKPE